MPTALADIVDNSIAAKSKRVWIDFSWASEESSIQIRDDGNGMSEQDLVEALRPGTHHPLEDRSPDDLGRFGLGLKTASFSQCRRLTVLSKHTEKDSIHHRGWDLDYVQEIAKKWQIINYVSDTNLIKKLTEQHSGTLVFWEKLDRVVLGHDNKLISEAKFLQAVREVENHLAMVFHRYLESGRLRLFINQVEVKPWDPFLRNEDATQFFPTESFSNDQIRITGYVLPHISKISKSAFEKAAGPKGWNEHQGFYIYRNDRLLVAGGWLRMYRKEEHVKLARIMIEIDTSFDFEWQLDIRKSSAIPPALLRDELKRYSAEIRKRAIEVYRHRGRQHQRKSKDTKFEFSWITIEKDGRDQFRINRNHPLVRTAREKLGNEQKVLERLLLLLEGTLPIPGIVLNESRYANESVATSNQLSEHEVVDLMSQTYQQLLSEGKTHDQTLEELYFIDPISDFPHLVEKLKA